MTGFIKNLVSRLRPTRTWWVPASALVVLCLATDSHAISQTRKDIEELQRNMFIMQSDISDLKAMVRNLPSEEDLRQIRQTQANITTQLQDLLREVQVMTGRFEESRYFTDKFMKQTSAEIDVLNTKVDAASSGMTEEEARELIKRVETLEAGLASLKKQLQDLEKAAKKLPKKTAPERVAKKETPENLYEEALDAYKSGKFGKAREMMGTIIRKYPDNSLSGNAQFWIAETYYAEKAYADAILAYEDLLQKYKGHNKVPAALLKQAFSFLELGDEKAARGILRELIENHPDSEQAKIAKDKLKILEGGSTKSPEPQGPPSKPVTSRSKSEQ